MSHARAVLAVTAGVLAVTAGVLAGLTVLVVGGPGTFFPLLLLAATVVMVGHEVRTARPRPDTPTGPPMPCGSLLVLPSVAGASSLASWSERELGRAWQTTFTQLQRHHTAAATETLAQARGAYLDELQRRDPTGFAAWIAAGARAGSDPTRYLTTPPRTP